MAPPTLVTTPSEPPVGLAARRAAMTAAAATLLIQAGPRAITHRSVAQAAGVPVGSANYIFPTRAELYASAVEAAEGLRLAAAREFAAALPRARRGSREVAGLLIRAWYSPSLEAGVVHSRLEPMLGATADPELQAIMRLARPRLLAVLAEVLERSQHHVGEEIELVAQAIDASLLYASGSGEPDPIEIAVGSLARLLDLIARAESSAAAA